MSEIATLHARTFVRSPAKINWTLRVLRKREDGFHEIESLVSTVTLYDDLEIRGQDRPGILLECDSPAVPTGEQNLVWRAAKLLGDEAGWPSGVRCRLTKRIPVGGGLGGGSSNAAAALIALNEFWNLRRSRPDLARLAAELGSDVPLFLEGGSAMIRGRGEQVSPVRFDWRGWIVLLMPGFSVATAEVYRAWRPGPPEARPAELAGAGSAIDLLGLAFNMLEAPAIEVCPPLGAIQQRAAALAGRPVRVSGSGSTLFTAFDQREQAAAFARSAAQALQVRTEVVQLQAAAGSSGGD